MSTERAYLQQVRLLLRVLPLVDKQSCFALKGGTAINLFVRDLPRLSVDIDLVYLPVEDRATSLARIQRALDEIAAAIQSNIRGASVTKAYHQKPDALRLLVDQDGVRIKVELSPVLRGTVYEPQRLEVTERVERELGYAEVRVVHLADLYAGKICAALDRQHPRDLFDVQLLLDNEGLTEEIRKATLVYLISHSRPIAELLQPSLSELSGLYHGEFMGMTANSPSLADLEITRARLIATLNSEITDNERDFLLSFKQAQPQWQLLALTGVQQLPAVRWKLQNIKQMESRAHGRALEKLAAVLAKEEPNKGN